MGGGPDTKEEEVPAPSQAEPHVGETDVNGVRGQGQKKQQQPVRTSGGAQTQTPAPAAVEQFGRLVVAPGTLASDEELAKLPRMNLWDELTKSKPPRINADDASKLHPGTQKFISSLEAVHYPGNSGMLAIYDKGGTKPILDLSPNNIVAIHKEGDLNDAKYLTSTEHLDAVLKGAALSKMTNQPPGTPKDKATCVIETPANEQDGKPSLSKLIMAYAAEKTGLHAVGSDGNKIDTSGLPKEVKAQMDAEWDKMKKDYSIPAVTETFNPAARPASSPAQAVTVDPNKALSAQEIAAKVIDNANKRFAGTDVNINEISSVAVAIHDKWGASLMGESGLTGKAKTDTGAFLEKINDGNLKGDQLVQLVTDYQNTLKADGFDPAKDPKNAQLIENISMATQAFAAAKGANGVDPKLYHQFQPDDGLSNTNVGITQAPATAPTRTMTGPERAQYA